MAQPKIKQVDAICLKVRTGAQWSSNNPVLMSGELGLESDTLRMKIGDGVSRWDKLTYTDQELRNRILSLEAFAQALLETTSAILNNQMKGES